MNTAVLESCSEVFPVTLITSRVSRRTLTEPQRRTELWPLVDKSLIKDPSDAELFERRSQSVCGFLRGERLADLAANWRIPPSEVHRMLRRAIATHPDGRIWGFRALIPGVHVVDYRRVAGESSNRTVTAGYAGMLTRLFRLHPNVEIKVVETYLKKTKGPHVSRMPLGVIYPVFLSACRAAGVRDGEYPFTVRYAGRHALGEYLRRFYKTHLRAVTRAQGGEVAARTLNVGSENRLPQMVWMPLQRVGFDGHRIDAVFMVKIPHRKGGYVEVLLNRPWLLVIVDIATRAVLGWVLSLNPEYTKEDVMKCVRSAVEPGSRPILTTPNLVFHAEGGMPSWVIPAMRWALWTEMSYDNGKANLSEWVRHQIIAVLDGAIHPGPVATPEHQAIMEALFQTLEDRSCQLMPNTTGSSPKDPRRNNPDAAARRYGLLLTHLEELLTVVISNYNGTPHESLGYRSPLAQMEYLVREEGVLIRHLRPEKRRNLALLTMKVLVHVRGNPKKGRRLYVQFEKERYSSDALACMPELRGKQIEVVIDTEDLVTITAFLPNGAELGKLVALGGWGDTKHSLATRRATNRLYARKILHEGNNSNPVMDLLDHLKDEAPKNRKAASRYEQVRRDSDLAEDFNPSADPVSDDDGLIEPSLTPSDPKSKRQVVLY